MPHRNAPLTETGRLRLARCVVDDGWPVRRAAERFQVSHTTASRWAGRYRTLGVAGMSDRSSRPHHQPRRTAAEVEAEVLRLRREHRIGPLRLAVRCRIAASTAHRILVRNGQPPLAILDRATGEVVRRYERARPGELVHIDVKKLGRIPDGGGHKALGRAAGSPNKNRRNGAGYAYLHTALDDHSRLAYTEDLPDETAPTCAGFLTRATTWFAAQGITIERVLTDNAWAYSKNTWRNTCRDLGISPRWTRPWRPQTNGKVERFHRTLLEEWAYQKPYASDRDRMEAFTDWLHWYNYHRPHTGIGGQTPASRGTNLSGQHT
ncbi:IS481 family transposase [Streptomyces sp. WAC06614]|uniref:IS481 family transposase n=1 Tax=Streptomyces sp. WAC06614 TaxID=2487416 RepID=UPI00163BAA5A|nr:IS481 family transposase [Streptomyces sp. WAC06614]